MGLFDHFPYTNVHELNLDWILIMLKDLEAEWESFTNAESLKFADPIQWSISSNYEKSTIVINDTGNAYLSLQAVPAGIQLNNDEYWLEIFNFTEYTRTANQNLTVNTETNTTRATAAYQVDDWLIWNDVLYKVISAISFDDLLVIGSNIEHFTVEDFCKAWISSLQIQYDNFTGDQLRNYNAFITDITAQIDRLIAGATSETEILDAREEYDGIVATTLKNAIHDQVNNLGFGTAVLNEPKENFFDIFDTSDADFLVGYGFSGTTGEIVASTDADITGYIKFIFGDKMSFYWRNVLLFNNALSEVIKVAFYDDQKNWIKTVHIRVTPYASGIIEADFNGYVRIQFQNTRPVTDYHLYITRIGITEHPTFDYLSNDDLYHHVNYTPIKCDWKYGNYTADGAFTNSRGKKRVYMISNDINDGSVVCFPPGKYSVMFRVFPDPIGNEIIHSNPTSDGNVLITDYGYPTNSRQIYIQIMDPNGEDLEFSDIYNDFAIYNKPKIVDLFIFSGQSNMAGRGASTASVNRCAGYEFRAISDPTRLYPITDPFGVNENVNGAIDDGSAKTGSCVPSFVSAYYRTCRHTIVAISASDGGTGIDDWLKDTPRYDDMVQRYNDCVAYLTANGYVIDRQFLVWHQGEHDRLMTPTEYKNKLIAFADDIRADTNIENLGILRVGTTASYPNPNVIAAQTQLCEALANHGCIMLYTLCANFSEFGYMKSDDLHYNQSGLTHMGKTAGNNLGYYVNTRRRPLMKDLYYNNIYAPIS